MMAIVEEVNLFLAVLHKGFSVRAFYDRLLWGGYRVKDLESTVTKRPNAAVIADGVEQIRAKRSDVAIVVP